MPTIHVDLRSRSLLERIIYGLLLLVVLVLGFFFLVAALIAGAVLAGIVLLRLWWLKRRLKEAANEEFITAEYAVIEPEQPALPPVTSKNRQD